MANQVKNSNSLLFDYAFEYCVELKKYLKGEIELDNQEISAKIMIIRKACKESFYFFTKAVLGFDKLVKNPHKFWCDKLQIDFMKYNKFARLKPRGTFKTTIYGEAFPLWIWAFYSTKIRFFYTSANKTLLEEVSSHMDHFICADTDSLYYFVTGIKRDSTSRVNSQFTFNIIGRDKSAKGSSMVFRTAGGSINGIHPHFIIIDDPMDKEDRESETIRKKKERWFDSLTPLLTEIDFDYTKTSHKISVTNFSKIMLISTRWHMDDLVTYIQKIDAQKQNKEDKFDFESEGVYDNEGNPRYGDFFPEEKIRKIKESISDIFFACQYYNNPLPEGMKIFDENQMFFMRMEQSSLGFDKDGYFKYEGNIYCFLDPSKGKKNSDYPAVVWLNIHNHRKFFFDAIDKKIPLSQLLALIAQKNKVYRVPEMIFEDNGSNLIQETLEDLHKKIDHPINIDSMHHSTNKHERIIAMQPHLYNGTVFFRDDYKKAYPEMMNQIFLYPVAKHDDFPDVVEMSLDHVLNSKQFQFVKIGANGIIGNNNAEINKKASQFADTFAALGK